MSEDKEPKIIVVEDKKFDQAFYEAWKQLRKESGKPPTFLEQCEELRDAVVQLLRVLFAPIESAVLWCRERPFRFACGIALLYVVLIVVAEMLGW